MEKKKLVFLTGTRADFGKIKSVIAATLDSKRYTVNVFVTGMHMNPKYGYTVHEVRKCNFPNIYCYINGEDGTTLDQILSNTITGFGQYVKMEKPDMIVVHGDRVEALAGALVGSLNNILVAHIEGGEVSGTIDEHIRHAVSKMSHVHFVSNEQAKKRLIQMGEDESTVYVIGSPDLDIMMSGKLPDIKTVKERYQINFENYALLTFHPVTTELDSLQNQANVVADALIESGLSYVGVYPNNDPGTDYILNTFKQKLFNHPRFKFFPSIRFEHYLTLIKHADFVIGNSSSGIREAPFYGVPSIDIGTRQNKRAIDLNIDSIRYADTELQSILNAIKTVSSVVKNSNQAQPKEYFGSGDSCNRFIETIEDKKFWSRSLQKEFTDFKY